VTLQTSWRGYRERAKYQRIRHAVIVIQSGWRGMKARRRAKRRHEAAQLIRRFIKGFIYRHEEYCAENDYFVDHVRYSFLKNLRKNLPKNVLDKNWPTPPTLLVEASEHLQRLHMRNMVIKYCRRVQPEWKKQMMQKVVASEIFKDQKDSYPYSVGRLFLDSRLEREQISLKVLQTLGSEKVQYGVSVIKYDRRGFKPRPRQLLLTNTFAVLVDRTKIKQRMDYAALRGISVSSHCDGMVVLHMPCEDNKQKGDAVLHCSHVIELVTKLAMMASKTNYVNISLGSIRFAVSRTKEGIIDFIRGSELKVAKGKRGHLLVTTPQISTT
ncbi:Unconventional myosin-Ic, partial [Ataeniobius toweri]|nr:Unconventional myosin-Ic [Ataeniobius toweri]